jgi:hypothetical protein
VPISELVDQGDEHLLLGGFNVFPCGTVENRISQRLELDLLMSFNRSSSGLHRC